MAGAGHCGLDEENKMRTKVLEIRDEATFILVLAVDMNPPTLGIAEGHVWARLNEIERWALRRCGYPCDGTPNILMTRLDGNGQATNDPYGWGGRTFPVAHDWIIRHWVELSDGDVVDVQYILGETSQPKVSERITVSS